MSQDKPPVSDYSGGGCFPGWLVLGLYPVGGLLVVANFDVSVDRARAGVMGIEG